MVELPVFGFFAGFGVLEEDGIRTHFTKAVKVQLTHKGRKIVMLEVLWNEVILELLRVLNDKSQAIVRPKTWVGRKENDVRLERGWVKLKSALNDDVERLV